MAYDLSKETWTNISFFLKPICSLVVKKYHGNSRFIRWKIQGQGVELLPITSPPLAAYGWYLHARAAGKAESAKLGKQLGEYVQMNNIWGERVWINWGKRRVFCIHIFFKIHMWYYGISILYIHILYSSICIYVYLSWCLPLALIFCVATNLVGFVSAHLNAQMVDFPLECCPARGQRWFSTCVNRNASQVFFCKVWMYSQWKQHQIRASTGGEPTVGFVFP